MSLEKELNKVLSEALPPRRDPGSSNLAPRTAKPAARPSSPQQRGNPDFAAARKAMRRPMVDLDAQVHNIDKMLNVTQKDPSQLGSTVQQIEKSFDGLFDPLKQVRSGVQQLKTAADEFNAEYVGEKPRGLPEMTPDLATPRRRVGELAAKRGIEKSPTVAGVRRAPDDDEDRTVNRVVTDIEQMNREQDKLEAAQRGWQEYQKTGGKMNRGEYYRSLIKKLRLPSEQPQESSVQRRKSV